MCCGRITFIGVPGVVWKIPMLSQHIVISIGFCQNTRRSNGGNLTISFHDAFEGDILVGFKPISIYKQLFRCNRESLYGLVHSFKRSI